MSQNSRAVTYTLRANTSGVPGLERFQQSLQNILNLQERLQRQGDTIGALRQQTAGAVQAAEREAQAVREAARAKKAVGNEYAAWQKASLREQEQAEKRAHQEGMQRLRDRAATMQLNARLAAQVAAEEKRRNREGINGIENEVKAWRNLWQSRVVGNDQVYAQQARLRQQALEMALTVDKQSDAYKRLTAVAAAASRTMDASQGRNTPGGFSFGVSQGITNALGQFGVTGDLISGFVQLIAAKRAAARNEAADLGRDTMAGLAGGLRTGTVPVTQAADAAADSVSEAIRRSLDIHSPSRVTEYLGRMTGLGFVQGIKALQDDARAAAAGLANAAESGMSGRNINGAQTAQRITATSGGGMGGSSNAAEAAAALAALNAQLAANAATAQAVETAEENVSSSIDGLGESVAGATENVRGLVDARREEDEESRNVAMNEAKTALAYAATAAALTGVAVAVSASINAAADYEQAMSKAGATTQATAGEMRDLDAVAKSAPLVKMGVDATEAAAGIEELGSAGLSTAQIIDGGLQSSLALAGAVSTDIGTAASVSAASVKAFGLEAKDLAHVADVVTNAVNGTSVKMENFADAIAAGGSTAQQTGLDFTTFTAAISFMTDKAIGASDAGTSLKTFLMALTPNSKDAAKAMKELGFSAFDTEGNFKPLGQVVEELRLAFSKLTPEQRASKAEMIFGADGIRAFNILVEQGAAGLKERTDQLNEMGTADKAQADKLESLRGKQEQFNAALTNFKIVVGEAFLPGMTDATEAAAKFLQVLMDINREQGNLNQGLAAYGAETYDLPTWLKNSGLKESDLRPAEVRQVKDLLARMQREASQGAADAQAWRNVGAEGSAVRREAETARAIGKLGQQLGELQRVISVRTSGQNPLAPPTSPEAVLATFMKAIAKVESQGTGNYKAFNTTWDPRTTAGQGAVGRYQFMPFNLIEDSSYRLPQSQRGAYARANMDKRGRAGFGWDFEATGRDYTIREILNDPQVQDKIAQYKIKQWFEQELKKTNNDVEQAIKNTAGRWNGSGADGNYARQVLNHYRDMTAPVTTLSGEGPLLPGQVRTSPGAESFRAAAATQALMATGVRTADEVVNYCAQWVRVTLGKADKRVEGLVNSMFQKDRNGDGDMDAQDAAAGVKAAGLFRDFRSVADLKPGDTVFYTDGGQNHAGIYLGDGMVRGNNRVTYQENGGRFGPGGIASGVALDAGKVNPVGTVAMTRLGRVTGYMSATELAVRAGVMTGEPLIPGPKPKDDQKLIAEARRILTALSNAEKSGNLTAKVAAQGVLDAFTKSGPRAAAAVEYVQSQVKAASKEVGKFGQGYDKLKGQLEQAGSLFKINDDTQAYIKSLDAVTNGAQAAAAAERKRNGETEKYRALLALAGDAAGKARQERGALQSDQDRADQEAATRAKNRAQTQQNLQKALAEGREADARVALDNLKRSQAAELALAQNSAAKRAEIVRQTGPAIIVAEDKLAQLKRDRAVAAANETARELKKLDGADLNAIERARLESIRQADATLKADRARARVDQQAAQQGANQAALQAQQQHERERKRLMAQAAAEARALRYADAEATLKRIQDNNKAELDAFKGTAQAKLALIRAQTQAEFDAAEVVARIRRDNALRENANKYAGREKDPNKLEADRQIRQAYTDTVSGLRDARASAVRVAQQAVQDEAARGAAELAAQDQASYEERRQWVIENIKAFGKDGLISLYSEARATRDGQLMAAVMTEFDRRTRDAVQEAESLWADLYDKALQAGEDPEDRTSGLDNRDAFKPAGQSLAALIGDPQSFVETWKALGMTDTLPELFEKSFTADQFAGLGVPVLQGLITGLGDSPQWAKVTEVMRAGLEQALDVAGLVAERDATLGTPTGTETGNERPGDPSSRGDNAPDSLASKEAQRVALDDYTHSLANMTDAELEAERAANVAAEREAHLNAVLAVQRERADANAAALQRMADALNAPDGDDQRLQGWSDRLTQLTADLENGVITQEDFNEQARSGAASLDLLAASAERRAASLDPQQDAEQIARLTALAALYRQSAADLQLLTTATVQHNAETSKSDTRLEEWNRRLTDLVEGYESGAISQEDFTAQAVAMLPELDRLALKADDGTEAGKALAEVYRAAAKALREAGGGAVGAVEGMDKLVGTAKKIAQAFSQVGAIFDRFRTDGEKGPISILGDWMTMNVTAAEQWIKGDYVGAIVTTVNGILDIGESIANLDPGFKQWKKNLSEVAALEKQLMGAKTIGGAYGMNGWDNPYHDALSKDAANREALAGSKWYQRLAWDLFGGRPEVMKDDLAKTMSTAAAIFNDFGQSVYSTMENSLMDAIDKGDFSDVSKNISKSLNTFVQRMYVQTVISKSRLKDLVKQLADEQPAGKDTSGTRAAIEAEMRSVAATVEAGAVSLPGFGEGAATGDTSASAPATSPQVGANFYVANSSKIDLFDNAVQRADAMYLRHEAVLTRHGDVLTRHADVLERVLRDGIPLIDTQGNYRGALR